MHNYSSGTGRSGNTQVNKQENKQAQLVDQNFANGTLFMALSTMETYEYQVMRRLGHKNLQGLKPHQKQFGAYDKYDYSHKSLQEVRDQLINNVTLLAHSKMAFERQYGPKSYEPPAEYNMQKVVQKVKSFNQMFKQLNDGDGITLTTDMLNILVHSRYQNLACYDMKFKGPKTGKSNQKQFIMNGMKAANDMHAEEDDTKRYIKQGMTSGQLKFKQNKDYKAQGKYQPSPQKMINQNQQNQSANKNKSNNKSKQQQNNAGVLDFSNEPIGEKKFKQELNRVPQPLHLILNAHKLTQQRLEILSKITTLQSLSMNNKTIDVQFVQSMLQNNTNLHTLSLNDAYIDDKALKQISSKFTGKIQCIYLNNNKITCQGLLSMFDNIHIKKLDILSVASNNLKYYNFSKFLQFLSKCNKFGVKSLNIANNQLQNKQAQDIGKCLQNIQYLIIGEEYSYMLGNLDSFGMQKIIKRCTKLQKLVIFGSSSISQSVISQINKLSNIKQLHIYDKNSVIKYKNQLQQLVNKNINVTYPN